MPPKAETTTMVLLELSFDTISFTSAILVALATEVPPNFKTFMIQELE
jgi:hypothetical protein